MYRISEIEEIINNNTSSGKIESLIMYLARRSLVYDNKYEWLEHAFTLIF